MSEFKNLLPYQKALEVALSRSLALDSEELELEKALGRVISEDIISPCDSPPFDRAAMDGYAIIAEDTFGVSESSWARLEVIDDITAGQTSEKELTSGKAIGIMTGAKMPEGANAVVMQEFVRREGSSIDVGQRLPPLKNVCLRGEDVKESETVLKRGTRLSAEHLAVLRSLGIGSVKVKGRPKASVIVTGDEFTDDIKEDGKIIESNSLLLTGLLESVGCGILDVSVVKDDESDILEGLEKAKDSDMILITGGSSFGKRDMSSIVFKDFLYHGVTIKPGRPFGLALKDDVPVFVMSGYPVAAFVQFYLFVIPFLEVSLGTNFIKKAPLHISSDHTSQLGRMEFIRCRLSNGLVEPIRRSGSSMISSIASADGFILIDEMTEGINKGDIVEFNYFI